MRLKAKVALRRENGLPLHLLAGRCQEIWSPVAGDFHETRRRFRDAARQWNDDHPDGPVVPPRAPAGWSYRFMAEQYGVAALARQLASLGLPSDRTPSPAPDDVA